MREQTKHLYEESMNRFSKSSNPSKINFEQEVFLFVEALLCSGSFHLLSVSFFLSTDETNALHNPLFHCRLVTIYVSTFSIRMKKVQLTFLNVSSIFHFVATQHVQQAARKVEN